MRTEIIPDTTDDAERELALPFSCANPRTNVRAWLTLMMFEATALGIVSFTSMPAILARVGGTRRSFARAIADLVQAGLIVIADNGISTVVQIDGRECVLRSFGPTVVDDPWQIIRAKVFATKGCQCHYCGKDASQVDHIIPRAQGGGDDLLNLVPACAPCNHEKGNRTPQQWRGLD